MKLNKSKIISVLKAAIPSGADLTFMMKLGLVFLLGGSFAYLIAYTAYQNKASANSGSVSSVNPYDSMVAGIAVSLTDFAAGSYSMLCYIDSPLQNSVSGIDISKIGCPYDLSIVQAYRSSRESNLAANYDWNIFHIRSGAVGMLVNSYTPTLDTPPLHPMEQVNYYVAQAKGQTYAADNTAGRNVLSPVFFAFRVFRNLAYALVIVILMTSALSSLLSNFFQGDQRNQKISIIQLLVNSGFCLILITFFYEISAIIYDLCVNWGNAIVVNIMEPFLNAGIIYQRLGPGGDLNVTALINVYQWSGINESLLTVFRNLAIAVPATASHSVSTANDIVPSLAQWIAKIGNGIQLNVLNEAATNFLESKAFVDAIFAWVFLFLQLKLFFNMLIAFLTFNVYVIFGPLLMLQAISGGYDKIKNTFKLLLVNALVFPLTFLFIMLSVTVIGFFIYGSKGENGAQRIALDPKPLCAYSVNDPIGNSVGATEVQSAGFQGNYTNLQTIFNVDATERPGQIENKEDYIYSGLYVNCRPELFSVPWSSLPIPMGNWGAGPVQIQTTDTLIRTFLSILFLFVAMRVPKILIEVSKAEPLKSLEGMGKNFMAGLAPTFSLFSVGLSGVGLGMNTLGFPLKAASSIIPGGEVFAKLGESVMTLGGMFDGLSNKVANLAKALTEAALD